jgi:hypothetical protein
LKKVFFAILIFFMFTSISNVYAGKANGNQGSESIVTCQIFGGGGYKVIGMSVPTVINNEQCIQAPDIGLSCASCIISLEHQGCKTVDVVTGTSNEYPIATYLLSCAKP